MSQNRCFITSIVNGQPKSCPTCVNINIPIISGSKRTCSGKSNDAKNPLVGFWHSEEYQADQKEFITMESTDTTHLPCRASTYEAIQIDGSNEKLQDTGSASDNFRYHRIDPMCMNIRLCIFWFLWALLIVMIILSILFHCCFAWKPCYDATINITDT
ncbi:uncharacterized protein LOC100742163 [Bombus impatiens]|uniref:Uncharacterized protein LOC100742163 n=1 Tax=Bombus impatiens TaxID=132113 RepID=A0A6P3E5V0_BOMIM|nr:uncharacterized protein LOC100742163 [Bombus impatiens]